MVRYVLILYRIGYNIGIGLIRNHCLGRPKAFKRLSPEEYEIVGNEPDEAVFKPQSMETFAPTLG